MLLIVVAIGAVSVMLMFVVPRFKEMIVQAGTEVPEQARVVFGASDWLIANGQMLGIALIALAVASASPGSKGSAAQRLETLLLRLPLVGNILRLSLTIRFCRTLGMLLENGVELPAAMKLVRDVIGSRSAALALDRPMTRCAKGAASSSRWRNPACFRRS